jgi:hypothetical protein
MKKSIHLLDPVRDAAKYSSYLFTRCGYQTMVFKPEVTNNTEDVTCTKCKSYINNPWRVLRKYGYVKVVEDMFVMVWGQYGYKFDMCAMIDAPGCWNIVVSHNGRWHLNLMTKAGNTTQLGFKLVDIIEKEIVNLKKEL